MRTYKLRTPIANIDFTPEYKVSLWTGIGSDGKSTLCQYIRNNHFGDFCYLGLNVDIIPTGKVILFDEDDLVDNAVLNFIKNSTNVIVIFAREMLHFLKMSYNAVYEVYTNDENKLNIRHMYKKCDT